MEDSFPFYKSIRTKAAILFFVVFIIIIIPANWLIFQKVKSTLTAADTRELWVEADKIASSFKLDPLIIPLPPNHYLLKLQISKDVGAVEIFTSPSFPQIPPYRYFEESIVQDTLKIVNLKKNIEYSADVVIISLARSTSNLARQTGNIQSYLIVANTISIILAGILVFVAAGKTLRPIKKIIATASHITASKSIDRVEVPSTQDESEQLAKTLNSMFARMEESIQKQVNFFASAAHELKTPLAIMQTEIGISLEKVDSVGQKVLQSQLHEVQRLNRLVEDFLLISQLKSETLTLRKKEEQLEEVIYASMRRVKYLIQDRQSQLQLKLAENREAIWCAIDFDKIEIAISNLLENAILYSPVNSTIQVFIAAEKDMATIHIINPIEKPIENFSLLKSEFQKSKELSGGLGMGLWICNQIIKLHQGKFELKESASEFEAKVSFWLSK